MSEERTSRITGRTYKSYYKKTDPGYSFPFGDTDTSSNQVERQRIITDTLKGIEDAAIELISFSPEKAKA